MPVKHFAPGPGRYGTHIVTAFVGLGSAGQTIANGAVTIVPARGEPNKKYWVESIKLKAVTAGVDTGTLTYILYKRNAAGTEVALTASLSLETDAITGTLPRVIAQSLLSTLTEAQRTVDPEAGEFLLARVTSQTTVSTQPNITVEIECALMK